MTETQDVIKNLISAGKRFLIACEPSADEAEMLAAHALKKILETKSKEVFFLPKLTPEFQEKFKNILDQDQNPEIPQKIKIKIPKNIPLEEMRYEDEGDSLSVVISPKISLEPSAISIEKAPYEMDAAFYFSESDGFLEKMDAPIAKPAKEKIVYLVKNERTLAEKVNELYELSGADLADDPKINTLLFAALSFETENMRRARANDFALAHKFLSRGAAQEAVSAIINQEKNLNFAQLLGRALARTTIDSSLKTAWTFLKARDFEKTKLLPTKETLLGLLKRVRLAIEDQPLYIFCYEYENEGIKTLFWGQRGVLNGLAQNLGSQLESLYFFGPTFANFSEAETKIRQAVKRDYLR